MHKSSLIICRTFFFSFSLAIMLMPVCLSNLYAQNNCTDIKNSVKKKNIVEVEKIFRQNLMYDNCTLRSIDTVINSIATGNMSDFNLTCLNVIHKYADGYASEYLAESMNKIVQSNFNSFLKRSFVMDTHNDDVKLATLVIDVSPFIKQDLTIIIKSYLTQLSASEEPFKKYLNGILSKI